jgi:hypothetical protein
MVKGGTALKSITLTAFLKVLIINRPDVEIKPVAPGYFIIKLSINTYSLFYPFWNLKMY